ncbi:MAG: DMT family transporter [Oscillospiraceae bacterium]
MNKYSLAIIGGGALWGFMGVFTRELTARGFSSPNTVFIRCAIASLFFGLTILFQDKSKFKMRLRDFWCFFGSGICSLLFFTVCYFRAIEITSLSTAAILLYTAPSFVMLMSFPLFGEKLTRRKVTALLMAFLGCCLVSGIGGGTDLTTMGLVYGLCAGFGYALYSIFARFAMLRGYDSLTINFYSCFLTAVGAGMIWGFGTPLQLTFASTDTLLLCLTFGFVVSYLPYLMYTYGLTKTENGKASVMASVEPVVATLLGTIVFHEKLSILGAAGAVLVLGAIAVLNTGKVRA